MDLNYTNYENAWDDPNYDPNAMALNERFPINNNQQYNYNSNEYVETTVESQGNVENGVVVTKVNAGNGVPDICQPSNLAYYQKIWKYMKQIKSIGAGQC